VRSCGEWFSYLREGAVVPEVTLVREAVSYVPKLALFDVLLDGIELLLLANLVRNQKYQL
jgi:hypothetical protein